MTRQRDADRFMIIAVCDGNICRSPLLELALRRRLPESRFIVGSAGLTALVGHPMDLQMQRIAGAAGLEPAGFRATAFDPRTAGAADLVLTMTVAQRDAVAGRAPRLLRRTFSLAEALINFVPESPRAAEERSPVESLRALVRAAAARRSTTRLTSDDDVCDPYRGDDALFDAVGARLLAAAETLAARLRAVVDATSAEPIETRA